MAGLGLPPPGLLGLRVVSRGLEVGVGGVKAELVRRWCRTCARVTDHEVRGGKHKCESCGAEQRRYDLTPRTWAGV